MSILSDPVVVLKFKYTAGVVGNPATKATDSALFSRILNNLMPSFIVATAALVHEKSPAIAFKCALFCTSKSPAIRTLLLLSATYTGSTLDAAKM